MLCCTRDRLRSSPLASNAPTGERAPKTLRKELRLTARLGVPLAVGELGWMSTYLVDALMVGRLPHSALSISASSLGNTIFYTVAFIAIGMLTGIETLVAQSFGRGSEQDREDCARTLAQSMWFVAIGTPLVMLASLAFAAQLPRFGVSAEISGEAMRYLRALVWSAPPLLLYMALRRYLQSINRVLLVSVSLVTGALVNLAGDWAFLFGHFGFRPMGIAGSGWATVVVRCYMLSLVLLAVVLSERQAELRLRWQYLRPEWKRLRAMAKIGWPPALQYVTDLGFSTWMSIVCARLGTTLLAAHQVVLDLDAFVYMVPMGLSWATVVRVGQSAGQGSLQGAGRSAKASLLLAAGYVAIAGSLFAGLPKVWGNLYTNDAAVVAAAAPVFLICAFNQLGDAMSVIFSSALTGVGETRIQFYANTLIYWLIGAPLSYSLAFHSSLSLRGLWMGRALSALLTAAFLGGVWYSRLRSAEGRAPSERLQFLQPLRLG